MHITVSAGTPKKTVKQVASSGTFFERDCWMINTVAQECWVATAIYRGLASAARS